jgi:PAS domain S-box-containing protein
MGAPRQGADQIPHQGVERQRRDRGGPDPPTAESTSDLVVVVDVSGRVAYVSGSSQDLLGYSPQEIIADPTAQYVHPEDRERVLEVFRTALTDPAPPLVELRCQHRSGAWRTFECRSTWIRDADGEPQRILLILRDVTGRRQSETRLMAANAALEARETKLLRMLGDLERSHDELQAAQVQLMRAEKRESVGRFAAGVAHEVKNPLTILAMGVEYVRRHLPPNGAATVDVLDQMDQAIQRANTVIHGLLDVSAPNALHYETVELAQVIERALDMLRYEAVDRRVTVQHSIASDVPALSIDATKIQQAIVNICLNAFEAMAEGGALHVHAALRHRTGARRVVLRITDTGPGIRVEPMHRVFEPFFTTKPAGCGIGLGLTVVERIVELHGGSVAVRNRAAQGAEVTITLPVGHANAA